MPPRGFPYHLWTTSVTANGCCCSLPASSPKAGELDMVRQWRMPATGLRKTDSAERGVENNADDQLMGYMPTQLKGSEFFGPRLQSFPFHQAILPAPRGFRPQESYYWGETTAAQGLDATCIEACQTSIIWAREHSWKCLQFVSFCLLAWVLSSWRPRFILRSACLQRLYLPRP